MTCAFCGKNKATHYTTERDFVCRDCAIGFELALQFGDDFERYEQGQASPELIAQIEKEKADWEAHFAEPALMYTIPDELEALDKAWTELKIEVIAGEYYIEILATAYDGIRYFWKLIGREDYMSHDRLFETQGQALDDALEFLKALQEAD